MIKRDQKRVRKRSVAATLAALGDEIYHYRYLIVIDSEYRKYCQSVVTVANAEMASGSQQKPYEIKETEPSVLLFIDVFTDSFDLVRKREPRSVIDMIVYTTERHQEMVS